MIFKQGYITASIDKFLHALGEQPENVKGYGNAARQGSEDMESILTVPIAIVRTFEYQNLQFYSTGTEAFITMVDDIVAELNAAYADVNIQFELAYKLSDAYPTSIGIKHIPVDPLNEAYVDSEGVARIRTAGNVGFKCADVTEEGVYIEGLPQSGLIDMVKEIVDISSVLTIVLVSALNNTPTEGDSVLPLSDGSHPAVDGDFIGFLPYYSLTDADQILLNIDYDYSEITPPTFSGGPARHQIYINLVGSMLGLLPSYTSTERGMILEGAAPSCDSEYCIEDRNGDGNCVEDLVPYIGEHSYPPWSTLLYDTWSLNASTCGDDAHDKYPLKYNSGDNVMTLRVDSAQSVFTKDQRSFIRGAFVTTNSPWKGFIDTASEYLYLEPELGPCDEGYSRGIPMSRGLRLVDISEDAESVVSVVNKIRLLCNNILNK